MENGSKSKHKILYVSYIPYMHRQKIILYNTFGMYCESNPSLKVICEIFHMRYHVNV